jgi:hypothetical protein
LILRLAGGLAIAVVIAALASGVSILGIALWKIVLALAGLALFILSGRERRG